MSGPVAVLDACALVPIRLATTLLWLAEAGLFRPLWSDQILDEVERNLPKLGVDPDRARRRVQNMRGAFGAETLVDGFEALIDEMACDPKDRHVLAVAVHEQADALVTFNLKDFPDQAASPHAVEILHPDVFLLRLLQQRPADVIAALAASVQDLRRPPETLNDWLAGLTPVVPMFANLAADALGEPPEAVSDVPALVQTDDQAAIASFGEPGDWTNPAQVVFGWYYGLLNDVDLAKWLTYDPAAWGDYARAREHLEGRSPASRVIHAVDAPDRIAFMRFVTEVAATAQVFQTYVTEATFITLIRRDDGTWRVWGLGPALLPAEKILGK